MGKPMEVISLEDFKSSRAMITVWEYRPPQPVLEVRKQIEVLNRLVPKIEVGTFNGKDFEEASRLLPDLVRYATALMVANRFKMLKALEAYDNQTVPTK